MTRKPHFPRMLSPYQALRVPCNKEPRVRGLIVTFLKAGLHVPDNQIPVLVEALVRQAKHVSKKQAHALSQAVAHVIGKYRTLWREHPQRGLYALWVMETSGFSFNRYQESISLMKGMHRWIFDLLEETGFHTISISADEWMTEEMVLNLAILNECTIGLEGHELHLPRSQFVFELMMRLVQEFGTHLHERQELFAKMIVPGMAILDAMELTAMLINEETSEQRVMDEEEPTEVSIDPVSPTQLSFHFRTYGCLCWHMTLLARRAGINKKGLLQWSYEMGRDWMEWLATAIEVDMIDNEMFELMLDDIELIQGRSQDELFDLVFAWYEAQKKQPEPLPEFVQEFDRYYGSKVRKLTQALSVLGPNYPLSL